MVLLYSLHLTLFCCLCISGSLVLSLCFGYSLCLSSDSSSHIFLFTLTTISISVLVWSYFYLDSELYYRRFVGLVFCFLFSMFLLLFASSLITLFVAWDLLGFTSFFLVCFYRSRTSISGALLTGLTNRLGDVLLLLIFGYTGFGSCSSFVAPVFLLFLVSMTKSAQVPFSAWLPAAMLAPTPVSALVHSSTLVTAGVYLLFRFSFLPSMLLSFIGALTTFLAGVAALCESDVKNIIALSTLSQLGVMVYSLGLGARSACFIHLNLHASYKALLFICVGCIIHSFYGSQESRFCSSLAYSAPRIYILIVIALLSMSGLTFLSGWVSKEAILFSGYNVSFGFLVLIIFYLGIILTMGYSVRLVLLLGMARLQGSSNSLLLGVSFPVFVPLHILLAFTIVLGVLFFQGRQLSLTVVSSVDALAALACLVTGLFVGSLQASSSCLQVHPFLLLRSTSSSMSIFLVPCSQVRSVDVSCHTLLYGTHLSRVLLGSYPVLSLWAKYTLVLCLCFVLL